MKYRFAPSIPVSLFGLSLLAVSLLALAACANPLGQSNAALSLSIGSPGAKTVVAGNTDHSTAIAAYTITATNTNDASLVYSSDTVSSGVCTITGITPGIYEIQVYAFSDLAKTIQIAQGSVSALGISAGATTSATITLSFSQSASTGGFALPIKWPLSTSLPYAYATLDGNTLAIPAVTNDGSYYYATFTASNLSGGVHSLQIYFKATSSATAVVGPFNESVNIWDGVTSTQWLDASETNATLSSVLTLTASDFADTTCTLAGLSVGSLGLGSTFAAGTSSYSFGSTTTAWLTPGTSYGFTITAASSAQGVSASFNGSSLALSASSGTVLSGSLTAVSGANSLVITVTAPDRTTSSTYNVSWTSGSLALTIDVNVTYAGAVFATTTGSVEQGVTFRLTSSNAVLSALDTSTYPWIWYLDGVVQPQTGSTFTLSPDDTAIKLGGYNITGSVTSSDGVRYSGNYQLTVTRRPALNLSGTLAVMSLSSTDGTSITLNTPLGIATDGTYLYVADYNNYRIVKVDLASNIISTVATLSQKPHGLALVGACLYATLPSSNQIIKIPLDGGATTTIGGFVSPPNLTCDGTYLYVLDSGYNIKRVNLATHSVVTFAGSGTDGSSNGVGTAASFADLWGISTDGTYVYVSEPGPKDIRRINIATAEVTTLLSSAVLTAAGVTSLGGLGTDGSNLYISNYYGNSVMKYSLTTGAISTLVPSIYQPRNFAIYGSTLYMVGDGNAIYKIN